MSIDSKLKYDQLIFKASHNSYRKDETISEQLTFNENEPYNGGCLALEFDIWRHSDEDCNSFASINEKYFTVSHFTPGDSPLSDWLTEVLNWHANNSEHYPILITLDIKSSNGDYDNFHDKIDTYLQCHFNENLIFKPSYFLKDSDLSLYEQVQKKGWPIISSDDLKGKFIFCLSGNKGWKAKYARQDLKKRYCFSDVDKSDSNQEVAPPTDGDIVFFNFHIHNKNSEKWVETIQNFGKQNLISRTYLVNSEENWNNCLRANVSAIATDRINDHKWAKVCNSQPFDKKTDIAGSKYSLKNKSNNKYRNNKATKMQDVFESPDCTFIFKCEGGNKYTIRNAKNNKYFDDTITSMSETVDGDGQKWEKIDCDAAKNEFYLKNCKNNKYMTKKASKLSSSKNDDEIYIIELV